MQFHSLKLPVLFWAVALGVSLFQHPVPVLGVSFGIVAVAVAIAFMIPLFIFNKNYFITKELLLFLVLSYLFVFFAFLSGVGKASPIFYNKIIAYIAGPILPLVSYLVVKNYRNRFLFYQVVLMFWIFGALLTVVNFIEVSGMNRVSGIASGKNSTASTLALGIPLLMFVARCAPITKSRFVEVVGFFLLVGGVIATGSRAGLLMVIIALLPFILGVRSAVFFVAILFLVFNVLFFMSSDMSSESIVYQRILEVLNILRGNDMTEGGSISIRYELLFNGLKVFHEHPLLGVGFSHPREMIMLDDGELVKYGPHNAYVFLLAETGVVGFLLFSFILFSVFFMIRKIISLTSSLKGHLASTFKVKWLIVGLMMLFFAANTAGIFEALIFWLWLSFISIELAEAEKVEYQVKTYGVQSGE